MSRGLKNKQANPIPVILGISLSVIFIAIGVLNGKNYISTRYQPAMATKQMSVNMFTTQTIQASYANSTAAAIQTLQAAEATQTQAHAVAEATQNQALAIAATQTLQYIQNLSLTPTPTPQLIACSAKVSAKNGAQLSDIPGFYYSPDNRVTLGQGSLLTVDGYLFDDKFVHITYNGQPGFLLADSLTYTDGTCKPITVDLSFIAGWNSETNWSPLVDDTFSTNRNLWSVYDENGKGQQLQTDINQSDADLPVPGLGQELVFSTEALHNASTLAFDLHTFISIQQSGLDNPSFGFRFFENDTSAYQIRIMPKSCTFQLLKDDIALFAGNMKSTACFDSYYAVNIYIDNNQILKLIVNGYISELDLSKLSEQLDPMAKGGINFSVNNMSIKYQYIVVTAPIE